MQLLGRTERWLMVQRERTRERIEILEADNKRLARQRDRAKKRVATLRGKVERKRQKAKRLRARLRAERERPWSRFRGATYRRGRRGPGGRSEG
jgi:chromosome segregation ATPase